ncbi:Circadian clock-controlled protein daywake [Anthophora plagiata]
MKKFALIGMMTVAIFGVTSALDLPDFLQVCKRNDPNMAECIKNSINNFKPYLKSGLPDYKIPSLEPLFLNELLATTGGTIKMKLRNLLVHGASDFNIRRLKASLETYSFIAELDLPKLSIEGEYDVDGKLILLVIRGSGPMSANFTNCRGLVRLQMAMKKGPDGEDYLNVSDLKTKISVGGGVLNLQNLFGGDPVLGEAINMAINNNFDAFIKELAPSLENAISNTFTNIANSILSLYTYNALFPVS